GVGRIAHVTEGSAHDEMSGWCERRGCTVPLAHEPYQEVEKRGNGEDDETPPDPSRRSPAEERRVEPPAGEDIRPEHDHRSCEEGSDDDSADHRKPGGPLCFPPRITQHEFVLLPPPW